MEQKIKDSASVKFNELKDIFAGEVREKVCSIQSSSEKEIRYEMLKGKAFNKSHNILVFGLSECSTLETDLKAVSTFFSTRMSLPNLRIEVVYQIGMAGARPRPLVVRFGDIHDRWAVWNKKSKIKYEKGTPVWLQEDLPKHLREDYRVLQRVAKMSRTCPKKYSDVKEKDYKISINGKKYDRKNLHRQQWYTPHVQDRPACFLPNIPHSEIISPAHSPLRAYSSLASNNISQCRRLTALTTRNLPGRLWAHPNLQTTKLSLTSSGKNIQINGS